MASDYYYNHKDKFGITPLGNRRYHLKSNFNLTIEQYEKMFEIQEDKCYICKGSPGKQRLCVDHSHRTGEVRKLLCKGCNSGIGHFKENIPLLQKAINYLKTHE